jgi:hypothetical protein
MKLSPRTDGLLFQTRLWTSQGEVPARVLGPWTHQVDTSNEIQNPNLDQQIP